MLGVLASEERDIMRAGIRHVLGVIAVIQLAMAAGCSHEKLSGASQDLTVTFTPSPPGAGRYTGVGNDKATMQITKLLILPADPETASLYGSHQLELRFTPFDPNNHGHLLEETEESEFAHVALSSGTYRVTRLEVTPLELIDDNVSPTPASCIESIAVIDGSRPAGIPSPVILAFPNPGDTPANLTFTIRPGQTKLAIKVNIPGLIAGYEASYTCTPNCFPGFPGLGCLTAFSVTSYKAALIANITIE
jgi:hypothetical protein